ncbi:MAG: flagellar protein FlgN [Candidatus Polarisedimenticolaceae bacterium]|nr:flagellar protein FlgN [Candidatus Polarisedimenticolaceae bacterium]
MINTTQQQLSQLLAAELKESHQLLDILIEEHQALSSSSPDLIAAISRKKLDAMQQVEQYHSKRTQFLDQIGCPSSGEEMVRFIAALPKESLIVTQWQELQDLARKLQHQNEINGGVIVLTQRHITIALDILSGKASVTTTYGRSGQTHAEATPQHLAKA